MNAGVPSRAMPAMVNDTDACVDDEGPHARKTRLEDPRQSLAADRSAEEPKPRLIDHGVEGATLS
jgi:hypothetical protein